MARNKKKISSDAINQKKAKTKKVMNPFEIHVNKEKMTVLGKKSKNDKGLPGISRAKAINKRKNTLLQEYKIQHKNNLISDKRIGEKSSQMSSDDKAVARFTAERIKAHKKKSIFNLADDEVLTHKGQVLTEIEKFDDPKSDDNSDDERNKTGKLDNDFTEQAHFGGGMLQDTGLEGIKTHKDLIDKLISESKKRKAEKQKLKEATVEMTEKLDSEWKDLIPLMKTKNKDVEEKKPVDSYDKMMRQLIFEARGQPTDRLKTEDEIAKEEKEKLEKLEEERLQRMRGEEKVREVKHRSADDLDDNFAYDSDPDITLSYDQEGKANIETPEEKEELVLEAEDDEESGEEEESEAETEDDLSDLKAESSESEDEEMETEEIKAPEIKKDVIKTRETKNEVIKTQEPKKGILKTQKVESTKDDNDELLKKAKEENIERAKEKARNELPYTFVIPNSYEELLKLLESYDCYNQGIIIERMIKCNHPSLGQANKEKLSLIFVYLLQFLNDLPQDKDNIQTYFNTFNQLINHLFDLAHLIEKSAHDSLLEIIKEKHEEYRKNHKKHPDISMLVFFKLVSTLFTTSDFRHQVVTPSLVFMEQILTCCATKTRAQLSYGLFVTTLVLEYTALSKRYSPATINYLKKILQSSIVQNGKENVVKKAKSLLVLENNCSNDTFSSKLNSNDLCEKAVDDEFKIRCLHVSVKLLEELNRNLEYLPSSCEIFAPIKKLLSKIPVTMYPKNVQDDLRKLSTSLEECKKRKQLVYLVEDKKKPKALRLYEPNVEKVFDYKKHKVQSKEKAERDKLAHKLKQEKKGALREIRRDKAFLGNIKLKQRIQSDLERKQKVNKIMAEANMQQSELNAFDRKKKRK